MSKYLTIVNNTGHPKDTKFLFDGEDVSEKLLVVEAEIGKIKFDEPVSCKLTVLAKCDVAVLPENITVVYPENVEEDDYNG